MNASVSEDSVAETALAKKNSDGELTFPHIYVTHMLNKHS